MLNSQGFNLWADRYDETVQLSEERDQYPFAGYKEILNKIFNESMQKKNSAILDIGFGTAVLTSKLYEHGHRIDGVDFSQRMIEIAENKMPEARLYEQDIAKGLPPAVLSSKYDTIICTYSLHHLPDEEKVELIRLLTTLLNKDGQILIGDIAFSTRELLNKCREESEGYWDDDEFYFVHEEISPSFSGHAEFYPVSHCGGIFVITA